MSGASQDQENRRELLRRRIGGLRCPACHCMIVFYTRIRSQSRPAVRPGLLGDEDNSRSYYPQFTVCDVRHAIGVLHRPSSFFSWRPERLLDASEDLVERLTSIVRFRTWSGE